MTQFIEKSGALDTRIISSKRKEKHGNYETRISFVDNFPNT